jgi:hyaluronan synthase
MLVVVGVLVVVAGRTVLDPPDARSLLVADEAVAAALAGFGTELSLYVPLAIFGLVRWSTWLARKIPAALYQPITTPYVATTSVITPVYKEDPVIFRQAIESWRANRPDEILAVIDVTDKACIEIASEYPDVTVMITDKPGKRPALVDGIRAAASEIVVLVDSDVIFEPGVIRRVLCPFTDPKIGGVGTRQKVYVRDTVWQRIADVFLDVRYEDEAPALTRMGQALSCLSGRTAAYRRDVLLPLLDDFMAETFLGKSCMSGEDKRLTTLVLKAGYNTYHQGDALVWSTFPPDFGTFIKQRIRWTRNSYRSDLRAMWEGWVWKRPYLAFILLDKGISPYTLLIGLTFFAVSLAKGHWGVAGVLMIWWLVSRSIKLWPHMRLHPRDLTIIPLFIFVTFMMTFVKAYALATVHHHKWLTRPVEVVNGQVVRSEASAAGDRTPLLTRVVGSALVVFIVGMVQMLAWWLQKVTL